MKPRLHRHVRRIGHHVKRTVKRGVEFIKGFTLVELLVAIVVLGALAVIVLLAVNPAEQLSRTRDATRKQAISQVGRALENYLVTNSVFPAPANLQNMLIASGDIKSFPTNPPGIGGGCASLEGQGAVNINGYCYNVSQESDNPYGAVIYSPLESSLENKKCGTNISWYAWSFILHSTGIVCTPSMSSEPSVIISEFVSEEVPPATATDTPTPEPTPTNTPTPTPTAVPTPTPTSVPPTPTNTPVPTNTPTPAPITCAGIGGVCKNSCTGGQVNQGVLNCTGGKICCK